MSDTPMHSAHVAGSLHSLLFAMTDDVSMQMAALTKLSALLVIHASKEYNTSIDTVYNKLCERVRANVDNPELIHS